MIDLISCEAQVWYALAVFEDTLSSDCMFKKNVLRDIKSSNNIVVSMATKVSDMSILHEQTREDETMFVYDILEFS